MEFKNYFDSFIYESFMPGSFEFYYAAQLQMFEQLSHNFTLGIENSWIIQNFYCVSRTLNTLTVSPAVG